MTGSKCPICDGGKVTCKQCGWKIDECVCGMHKETVCPTCVDKIVTKRRNQKGPKAS